MILKVIFGLVKSSYWCYVCHHFENPDWKWAAHFFCLDPACAPSPQPPLCLCPSVAIPTHIPRRGATAWSKWTTHIEKYIQTSASLPRTQTLSDPGFPSSARGGQQPKDAPLDRGSLSVKSHKENETEKGRIVESSCVPSHSQLRRNNGIWLNGKKNKARRVRLFFMWIFFSFFLVEWGDESPPGNWRHENWERNKKLGCGGLCLSLHPSEGSSLHTFIHVAKASFMTMDCLLWVCSLIVPVVLAVEGMSLYILITTFFFFSRWWTMDC